MHLVVYYYFHVGTSIEYNNRGVMVFVLPGGGYFSLELKRIEVENGTTDNLKGSTGKRLLRKFSGGHKS